MLNNKDVGLDEIPSELLKRGSMTVAVQSSDIGTRILAEEHWPTSCKGGRMVALWKSKGLRRRDCDSRRGFTFVDHFVQAFCGRHEGPC